MPELRLENSLVDERYEIRERLGLGSYAEIFVARDRVAGGQEVVIKALNTSLQGTPEEELERTLIENFQNEAVALDAVRHPHVILRVGHGTAADLRGVPFHYLVLEYMPGGDLLRLCRARPGRALKLGTGLAYFRQACEGLAYAHSRGVIHRDLKPNNFLLSGDQRTLKIADFGVAKMAAEDDGQITRVGAGLYAPPEHHPDEIGGARAERLTAAADIYSLAKSFYTVIGGRAPSEFVCRPLAALPGSVQGEVWAGALLSILRRATADDPAARYATVIEFWSDLAGVAALGGAGEESDDATTVVKPRLQVSPGRLPSSPEQPEFEPVLASSASREVAPAAAPALPRGAPVAYARPPKIVVDLKPPPPPPPARRAPAAPQKPAAKAPAPPPTRRQRLARSLTATLRQRLFVTLLVLAFLGVLVSTYHYANLNATPSRIQVVAQNLNVRSGPGSRFESFGSVAGGTRHKVLGRAENGWLRIEVGAWSTVEPRADGAAADPKEGWVNGAPEFVSVVSRRWW